MKKIALTILAAGFAVTAACTNSPSPKTPAAQPTTTTTASDANHDGLIDGGYSLTDYCATTAASSAIAKGVAVDRDVVAATCAKMVQSGGVKNTDDVDAIVDNTDWRHLAR